MWNWPLHLRALDSRFPNEAMLRLVRVRQKGFPTDTISRTGVVRIKGSSGTGELDLTNIVTHRRRLDKSNLSRLHFTYKVWIWKNLIFRHCLFYFITVYVEAPNESRLHVWIEKCDLVAVKAILVVIDVWGNDATATLEKRPHWSHVTSVDASKTRKSFVHHIVIQRKRHNLNKSVCQ